MSPQRSVSDWKDFVRQCLDFRPNEKVYRVRRDMFTEESLFNLEMELIFEKTWIYACHESEISQPNDFITLNAGRQPMIVTRDAKGELHAILNACAHRGTTLTRLCKGRQAAFACPFHAWTYKPDGKLIKVKAPGEYSDCFEMGEYNLKKARVASYKGFVFINLDVEGGESLEEFLGDAKVFLDLMVEQSSTGELEVLAGRSTYTYDGNWKLQNENGLDGYHVSTVHWNYAATMGRRKEGGTQAVDANGWSKSVAGVYGFEHGHILLWTQTMNPEVRPVYAHREEIKARVGETQTDFIVNQTRNLCVYPNVFLMDQFSTQIRVVRPISVDKTEVSIFCFAPKGESATDRATRIRQYEDFFNVTGMGTADDLEEFRACQNGYAGTTALWNDLSRGAPLWVHGPDENATKMGLKPRISGERSEDEGLFVCQHEYWVQVMRDALKKECEGVPA